jgi:2-polyprenyl-3-methyl-5-hydroxy-6-metoxy-1,4-benzoquinol methylase
MIDKTHFRRDKITDATVHEWYETLPYLTAYAMHTDLRVQQQGPAGAIGGDWERGGARQKDFLLAQGLRPDHTLLDVGCGTGRLARQIVPHLHPGHYTGVDLSQGALDAAATMLDAEGLSCVYHPLLFQCDGTLSCLAGARFDVIWCYAVFIHLPTDVIVACFESLTLLTFERLYFSYKPSAEPMRTGYKQYACPFSWYVETGERYRYRVEPVNGMPCLPQPMGVLTHA